ncbi:hypothetical protein C0Q70_13196 [Pomacea canaliculata]|uniref:Uncharacterized protein n=1 Tax=Pomacea canaliculata TaxID=400727 RepID=A0A2T7NWI9_POMCA|nr:hypothetical protein C0Q70_13196 [Pomacea canaliculata]
MGRRGDASTSVSRSWPPLADPRENKQRKTGGASLPKLLSVGPVPAISITHDANEDENDLEEELLGRHLQGGLDDDDDDEEETETRTPHIYVCIHADTVGHDRQLYVRVIDALICDFFVMSGPRVESGELFSHDSVREKNLSQANACVFVLDGASLNDPECFRDLSAAWAMNLPMVFVKNSSFSLPSPLPDFVLQHSLGMESPAVSRAFTPAFPMRHSSVTPTSDVTPDARPGQLRRRRSFSSMRSASPRCHVTGNSRRSEKRGQQDFREADVVLTLLDGYRHALVFEDTAGDDCALALRRRLQSLLDARTRSVIATPAMSSNSNLHQVDANEFRHKESSKFLRVPEFFSGDLSPMTEFPKNSVALHKSANDSRSSSSCLALASKSVTSLPRESNTPLRGPELSTGCGLVDQRSRGDSLDPPPRETIYLVCEKAKYSASCEPRLVKWPPVNGQQDVDRELQDVDTLSDLFLDSPTSFPDLDLSLPLNTRNGTPDSESSTVV